ncbi:MAG: protein-disulfide reductase DsbD N-terminal domain-containing protein [Bryobacteraceae bacterium]
MRFAFGLLTLAAAAQDPVSWTLQREGTDPVSPGARVVLIATARIQDGWALYSVTQRPGGPIPTRISIPAGQVVAADGEIVCDPPSRKHDPNFDMEVESHAGAVTCRVPARIAAGAAGQHKVRVEARYQVCNDQICLPPKTAGMETTLTAGRTAALRASQWMPSCASDNTEAWRASVEGADFHRTRRLDEASAAYARALKLAPARDPSPAEREQILKFAPRVLAHPRDPFPMLDAAAVMHAKYPWIAYHFFWEDDIDFPDDNDPCDHELMWVEMDGTRTKVISYYTYFHGRLLKGEPKDGAALVVVQWGKHGTMPLDWRSLRLVADSGDVEASHLKLNEGIPLEDYNRATWLKLSTIGRQSQDSPLARGWPLKFTGAWDDFVDFSKPVDIAARLVGKGFMKVGWFNNAVINRHFLRYNFSAKTEWPPALCR